MQEEIQLIEKFYKAFSNKDAEFMSSCYHTDAHFRDEVFDLKGEKIGQMWKMLCENGKDLSLEYIVSPENSSANWLATYTFSLTKRKVVNSVHAQFKFQDGKIIEHIDQFNFWKWSHQAFAWKGFVLGWTPFFRKKVKQVANANLEKYIAAKTRN